MSHLTSDKTKLLGRVRRLRGQMEAIERAVDEEKECGEVLHLVASVRGAIAGLTNELLEAHLQHHVLGADDEEERRKGVEDLSSVLRSYLK
ncbi:metal/formaldehyde-sensitive transcriptional repressor [Paracoccus sp. JM45]|jgi:DNA-binding FrmR family transcriptional regulator|uniref:metal/formaldehyde-sensitive transcriptional repressor n=1 Tax=Paracoccus sp. JM45 TaxID=2283626 RepID=UPI000E6B5EEA|nr:metal/formaldehyde-sensitive transcriptional repressor [Paracoccus sp. JM45]RJE81021.1 metal/formaldehyde-sensitive transcriptional repressor [Paracoccus sp. JM45]